MSKHSKKAEAFIADESRTDWHDESLWMVRSKRDVAVGAVTEWEALRELGSQIKNNVLSNLSEYLEIFETNALKNGINVHWAANAEEHNQIIYSILKKRKAKNIVKSKSMLTEECHLNPFLEKKGMTVIDTDLGERIIQMLDEPPSHIVMPVIHLKKEEVGALFHEKLNTQKGATDPKYLTEAARQHLRDKFLHADAAITGVNFAVAETGGVVVCTNEGNADMGVHLAPVQIHCMGIEKIIPRAEHLGVFTRLLARSATGQPITIFTSHFQRPRPDGEMHVVIVDNGRSKHLGKADFRNALKCIRCGACMNTCPIYRRSGGHSYDHTIPGPIGSILSPRVNLEKYSDLPFASTLCGSCSDVCPVKIDIHEQLYKWRQLVSEKGLLATSKKQSLKITGKILSKPGVYKNAGAFANMFLKVAPRFMIYNGFNEWEKPGNYRRCPPKALKNGMLKTERKMSRLKILSAVKKNQPDFVPLPEIPDFPKYEEPVGIQFRRIVAKSGTLCFDKQESVDSILANYFPDAKNIVAPGLSKVRTMEVDAESGVPDLQKIDIAILKATLAVAENGALWLAEKDCPHRVLPFITQHLILLVEENKIVQNMHQAYQQISLAENSFGVFIAGPSKTADIEQSLVIGAQGARSLKVIIR